MKKRAPFDRPQRLENWYRLQIDKLIEEYFSFPNFTTLGEITSRMVEYGQAKSFFQRVAEQLALKMVTQVAVSNARNWRMAASQASKGKLIHRLLLENLGGATGVHINQLVHTNSKYITGIPEKLAENVTKRILELQMQGFRSPEIVEFIKLNFPKWKHYQIQRLARTEVAKADTAITRARAQNLGLNWYQWVTSEDARVRKSHRKFDGVLVNWNDAPAPEVMAGERSEGHYHAGNIYNCRCVALPLISQSEIRFPVRVYVGGQIKRLTKNQFLLLNGGRQLAA